MAEWTGLEPATPGVTGRYSNQLNYRSDLKKESFLLSLVFARPAAGIALIARFARPDLDQTWRKVAYVTHSYVGVNQDSVRMS